MIIFFFFSSRRRHTRSYGDWSSDVCSSDLVAYDRAGKRLGSTKVTGGLDAIAYDYAGGRLVGLSLQTRRLLFFSDDLRPRGALRLSQAILAGQRRDRKSVV